MIERYISHENAGPKGARRKARGLCKDMRYTIIAISHTQVPMAGSTSTPHSPTWGKTELGYLIIVDTKKSPKNTDSPLPEIVEC